MPLVCLHWREGFAGLTLFRSPVSSTSERAGRQCRAPMWLGYYVIGSLSNCKIFSLASLSLKKKDYLVCLCFAIEICPLDQ